MARPVVLYMPQIYISHINGALLFPLIAKGTGRRNQRVQEGEIGTQLLNGTNRGTRHDLAGASRRTRLERGILAATDINARTVGKPPFSGSSSGSGGSSGAAVAVAQPSQRKAPAPYDPATAAAVLDGGGSVAATAAPPPGQAYGTASGGGGDAAAAAAPKR
jgi:hypothetical protein